MRSKDYETVIIGATGLGLGAALSCEADRVLIIESSASMASEWTETFNPGTGWEDYSTEQSSSELAQDVLRDMRQRNIVTTLGIHTPGLAALLFKRAQDKKLEIAFMTQIHQVNRLDDVFEIRTVDVGGFSCIRARRIIDTTQACLSNKDIKPEIVSNTIGIQFRAQNATTLNQQHGEDGYAFTPGAFEHEASIQLALDPAVDWPRARREVHQLLINRPARLKEWDCVAVATRLSQQVKALELPNDLWTHQPALAARNIIEGIEMGVASMRAEGVLS